MPGTDYTIRISTPGDFSGFQGLRREITESQGSLANFARAAEDSFNQAMAAVDRFIAKERVAVGVLPKN